ncbi:MAG: hypothetical protein ABFC34_10325 [Methanobacterium sp.]
MEKYKIRISLLLLTSIIFLVTISEVSADQSNIYVSTDGNDSWSGENPTWNGTDGPKLTVQNAINTATTNGTVNVASGTYFEKEILILSNVQITGAGSSNTIIDAQDAGIIFYVDQSVEAILSGLTLKNGNFMVGGAIYNNGNLQLNHVTFESNNALDAGGAVYNTDLGQLTITDCNFKWNTARNGGAIYNYGTGIVEDSSFVQNTGTQGGAITNYGPLTIVNSIFNSNHAIEIGGAFYNSLKGDVTITSSSFTENSVTDAESYGGAIGSYGLLTITGTILTSNLATYGGSVANTGKISAIATGNWWGSTDGPEESAICGDVNIDNWLTSNPSILNNLTPENSEEEPLLVMGAIAGTNTNIDTETTTTAVTDSETPTTSNNDSVSIETNNAIMTTTNTEQNSSTDSDPLTTSFPLASITWGCLMIVGGVVLPRRK